MLNDAIVSRFKKVYLASGYRDLRRGIDGLASIVRFQFELDLYDKNTLFLFCGRRNDRIKVLLWEGDGFLLMYKRLDNGSFRWSRSAEEAMTITEDQYQMLMQGLEIVARNPIQEVTRLPDLMQLVHNAEIKKMPNMTWQWITARMVCLSTDEQPETDPIEKNLPVDVDNTSEEPLNNSFSDVLSTVIMPNRQKGRISDNAVNLL